MYLTIPLESSDVRHEPVAKPHGLRRLKVGEPVRPETKKNTAQQQHNKKQHIKAQPSAAPRHETQHTGERKGLLG